MTTGCEALAGGIAAAQPLRRVFLGPRRVGHAASLRRVRARILFMPIFASFEAGPFKAFVSDWADVESFDQPGTGARRDDPPRGIAGVVAAGAERLDELGWDACVAVCDSHGQAAGSELAVRDARIKGLAVGHAALRYEPSGDGATLTPGVHAAARQLHDTDYRAFARAITQLTQGILDDAWADAFLENVPAEASSKLLNELIGQQLVSRLRREDLALLLAQHRGCMMWTAEGYEEAAAAFPAATAVGCETVPLADPAFHDALRELCARVLG